MKSLWFNVPCVKLGVEFWNFEITPLAYPYDVIFFPIYFPQPFSRVFKLGVYIFYNNNVALNKVRNLK